MTIPIIISFIAVLLVFLFFTIIDFMSEVKRQRRMLELLVKKLGGNAYWYSEDIYFSSYDDSPFRDLRDEIGELKSEISRLDKDDNDILDQLEQLGEKLGYELQDSPGDKVWVKTKRKGKK